jgi:dimethylhistidine N-methyltransferase
VRQGLLQPPRQLSPEYFYDDVGSALFEAITHLPEYGVTRAEERILDGCSEAVAARAARARLLIELGSGSGRKTRRILEAFPADGARVYCPIDVSPSALSRCRRDLEHLASIQPVAASYLDGLESALAGRPPSRPVLVLFLGGTIGNFDRRAGIAFLRRIRTFLAPGDLLLLGADLVKPAELLLPAYDDPAGVTAAFNRNLLARINRELGGNFVLARFAHEARYNPDHKRIEMHLRSLQQQEIEVAGAGLRFALQEGETIWTESSYRFELSDLRSMASRAGFDTVAQWLDIEWPFAVSLWSARAHYQAGTLP